MSAAPPRVAVALPVYDGEAYLQGALDALRAQTEKRWVAVVTDNASTDATPEVARRAAAADPRVRYRRNRANRGANGNFNLSASLARATGAPYVVWATHDDVRHPAYLARVLDALDARPDAVGAHTPPRLVDDDGDPYPYDAGRGGFDTGDGDLWRWAPPDAAALGHPAPARRLGRFLEARLGEWMVYGVFRADALAAVRPFAMPGVEDALCAELLLRGPFVTVGGGVGDALFDQRLHARSARHLSRRDYVAYETGVRPTAARLPSGGRALAFARAVRRAPLSPADRARSWAALARFAAGAGRLKNLVVPGPDNYLGLSTREEV